MWLWLCVFGCDCVVWYGVVWVGYDWWCVYVVVELGLYVWLLV